MARTVQDSKLDSRASRHRLEVRREPHWRSISEGMAVGYRPSRKPGKAGTWIAKHYTPAAGRQFKALGAADDVLDANGSTVLSFAQAQEKARAWFDQLAAGDPAGKVAEPYKVREACTDYVTYLRAERKTADDTEKRLNKHVGPELAEKAIVDLVQADIEALKRGMVRRDSTDPEVERRSKDSANRVLTMVRAALNRAFNDPNRKIPSDVAWRKVKPFRDVGRARVVHLDLAQSNRLIGACGGSFRKLVTAALLTGARPPHELADRHVRDFHPEAGTLTVVDGKTGARDIVLTREAIRFFKDIAANLEPDALLFPRDDGSKWGKNHHIRPMQEAVKAAKLPRDCTLYSCRHTHASQSILAGMNLKLLAENMGTSVRMLEVHYGKFIAASRRKLVEEASFKLGLTPAKPRRARSKAT